MAERRQLIVRLGVDGTIQAETRHIYGDDCVPFASILEDLCLATAVDSAYTEDYRLVDPVEQQALESTRDDDA